jgi:hypothetical protein
MTILAEPLHSPGLSPASMTLGRTHEMTRQTFMDLDLGDFGAENPR